MKLADKIKHKLMYWARGSSGYEIIIPNFFYGIYEMDLFRLTPSGIIYEYEIKISKQDFLKDFQKGQGKKHELLKSGNSRCNHFFFVVPKGLIDISLVPSYAGLIEYEIKGDYENLQVVKVAPKINKNKAGIEIYKDLAHSLSFRENIYKGKYKYEKYWKEQIEKQYKELQKEYLNK